MEHSTNNGKTGDGNSKCGQYRIHLDANKKQSSAISGREVNSYKKIIQIIQDLLFYKYFFGNESDLDFCKQTCCIAK